MAEFHFSGHETFHCKSLWLKKGYDFVIAGNSFNDEDAVIKLGVGKNMVSSIRYWLKAFGLINKDGGTTDLANYIFGEEGYDPYLEDTNTLWLLHYMLVSTEYATLYKQLFFDFHKERKDFSKSILQNNIRLKIENRKFSGVVYNGSTINKDINVLLKNYVAPESNVYEDYSAVLLNLNLIRRVNKENFEFNYNTKATIHPLIFLYAIKDIAGNSKIIEFDKLLDLALVFCISNNGLYEIFRQLNQINSNITFDNAAGEQLFAINEDFTKIQILDMYYKNSANL